MNVPVGDSTAHHGSMLSDDMVGVAVTKTGRAFHTRTAVTGNAPGRHWPDTPFVRHIDARFFLAGGDVIWSFQVLDINVWHLDSVVALNLETLGDLDTM